MITNAEFDALINPKPDLRRAVTDKIFRQIIETEKRLRDEKTRRLRNARLAGDGANKDEKSKEEFKIKNPPETGSGVALSGA